MEKSLEEILKKLERIDQTIKGEFQGGFVPIPPRPNPDAILRARNTNCKGANCTINCGPNINNVAGCGGS